MTFKHKLNFVIPEDRVWPEIIAGTEQALPEQELAARCTHSLDSFVIGPYVEFRRRGAAVEYSHAARPGYINVADARRMPVRRRNPFVFLVVARGDAQFPEVADFVIEHNGCRDKADHTIFLTHPPQPGLIPRNKNRTEIRTVVFKGMRRNLDPMFRTEGFAGDLARLGFELRVDDYDSFADGTGCAVHDFHSADISFAARNITLADALGKPANKLVNAWRAGTPALLGPEPGYREIRRSELDYFEVRSETDVIAALTRLRKEPELYDAMVENGRKRAEDFTPDIIFGKWIDAFNGPIAARYEAWQRESAASKLIFAARAALKGKKGFQDYLASVQNGPRIMDPGVVQ
jgi:hypothetical protein